MSAPVYSSLLLLTLTICSLLLSTTKTVTEGLPLHRQERGTEDDSDILAGADFLSVFMSSSLIHEDTTTAATTLPPTTRETRSTTLMMTTSPSPIAQTQTITETTTAINNNNNNNDNNISDAVDTSSDSSVIVAVSVSSSIGRTLINKQHQEEEEKEEDSTVSNNNNLIASQEHENKIVAEANKSEFSVEESEPITTNRDLVADFTRSYPASVQPLPNRSARDFLKPAIQETVIYHNNPGRARSVSYSTVIQSVPNHDKQPWKSDNYETSYENIHINHNNNTNNSSSLYITTERNWGIPEKSYNNNNNNNLPTIYGQPEQNYEIDESASVMTNGRIHGVQPPKETSSKKSDDSQKVGYVVEGRNYRKYRVEERTADGFIVGEYGVVSHDDGSLRGVRYTADGTISRRLIHDALMKFLSL